MATATADIGWQLPPKITSRIKAGICRWLDLSQAIVFFGESTGKC